MMYITINRKQVAVRVISKNKVQLAFLVHTKTQKGLNGSSPDWIKKYSISLPLTALNRICDYANKVAGR